jgi:hypothetical protein
MISTLATSQNMGKKTTNSNFIKKNWHIKPKYNVQNDDVKRTRQKLISLETESHNRVQIRIETTRESSKQAPPCENIGDKPGIK